MSAILRVEGKADELILIELQSTMYMEDGCYSYYMLFNDGSKLADQDLGILEVTKEGNATLTNGPRALYGKMQELKSPLVLMERKGQDGDVILAARGVVHRKAVFNQRPQLSV
ncbi:unnamed protein product [Effrenium voratum]|uniref:Uncharacterized protein n=1 Tax=Effrenium voratum TaxID=2562239 RepID=A0AA36JRB9_9DINO|nr:unnamed protein product [Effrenium voratum]CAJ1439061.1 unnamed protein product [Effrenium voratum]